MNFEEYLDYFTDILEHPEKHEAYQDEKYYTYTKLNHSRTQRWLSRYQPSAELSKMISQIRESQHWIVITEPWCGDAAHSVPQLYNIAKNNKNVDFEIQLRDSEPFLIDEYLTNGTKSIPKLIIRNEVGHDLFVWGPRPEPAVEIREKLIAEGAEFEEISQALQKWYNEDKGQSLEKDLIQFFNDSTSSEEETNNK